MPRLTLQISDKTLALIDDRRRAIKAATGKWPIRSSVAVAMIREAAEATPVAPEILTHEKMCELLAEHEERIADLEAQLYEE